MTDKQEPNEISQQAQQEGARGAEGAPEGQEPKGSENGGAGAPVLDSHGQPGINKERHDREMAEKDRQIADLQAQLEKAVKTEEGRAELQRQLDETKASLADMKVTHALEMAGCLNVKMAKAVLDDYAGDISKVREACPYLFEQQQKGSTGLKPGGAPSASKERRDKARKAAGLE